MPTMHQYFLVSLLVNIRKVDHLVCSTFYQIVGFYCSIQLLVKNKNLEQLNHLKLNFIIKKKTILEVCHLHFFQV